MEKLPLKKKLIYELDSINNMSFFFFIANKGELDKDKNNLNPETLFYKIKGIKSFLKYSKIYRYINESKKIMKRVIINKSSTKCIIKAIIDKEHFSLFKNDFGKVNLNDKKLKNNFRNLIKD
jgi:hypothetical protein